MQALNRTGRSLAALAATAALYAFVMPHPWPLLDWSFAVLWTASTINELRALLQP